MNKLLAMPLLALASMSSTAATAQSGPEFQFSGVVMMEAFITSDAAPDYYGFADINVDFAFATIGAGVQVGVEFDLFHFGNDDFDAGTLHGVLYADFGNHRLSVGVPKGAFATYRGRSVLENSGVFAVDLFSVAMSSISDYVQLAIDEYAVGARYDGQFGAFDVSASYTQADIRGGTGRFAAASVQYTFSEAVSVWASAERFDDDGAITDRAAVGVNGSVGAFEYALSYSDDPDFIGQVLDASVFYSVNDNFEIGLGTFRFLDGSGDGINSLSAEYTIADRYFVRATVFDSGGPDPMGALNIGMEF